MRYYERTLKFYTYDDWATIVVFDDADENLIGYSIFNDLYSVIECLDIFKNEDDFEILKEAIEKLDEGEYEAFKDILDKQNIEFIEQIIDHRTFEALQEYLVQEKNSLTNSKK